MEQDKFRYKFRAWDNEQHIMWNNLTTLKCLVSKITFKESAPDAYKNFIFMQFTGLLDKNGKEIYEGDIVRITESHTTVFEWVSSSAGFKAKRLHTRHLYFDDIEGTWPHYEVIGNIYEHSHLLREEP